MFHAVFVFSGVLSLPQPALALLCRRCQNSGVLTAITGWFHRHRLTAFIGVFSPSLQSKHLHHHCVDLMTPDLTKQKSLPSAAARAAWSFCPPLHCVTSHTPQGSYLCHVSTCHYATSALMPSQHHVIAVDRVLTSWPFNHWLWLLTFWGWPLTFALTFQGWLLTF